MRERATRRRLSACERFVWAAGQALPVNIAFIARIQGRAEPSRLREALAAARRRHPLLAARVASAGRWRAWLTTEDVPDPELRLVRATAPDSWARVAEEELQRPFDTAAGPLTRFVLVDAGDSFDLISVYHHLAADASSAAIVIHDILRGPAEGPSEPAVLPPPADALLPRPRPDLSDLRKLARSLSSPTRPAHHSGPLTFTTWSLGEEETSIILARCRAEGTTLQAALCTAFARDFGRPVHIAVAADLRRILAPAARSSVGLYATSFLQPIDTTTPDFWTQARKVKADIHRRLTPDELGPLVRAYRLLPFIPHQAIGSLLHRSETQGARFDVSISNARLPIPTDYGPLRLSALYGAAHTSLSGAPLVLVIGINGRLCLSVTSTDATGSQALCKRAMSHLTAALVSSSPASSAVSD
ncbi:MULTISPECIES: condensation domain-containing protein [unclassified Streptomyces]|uniref:condensation domain-containing protein n=1 Tax=unclassified Streptomyces TaxID=2593676 RepID=UPI002E25DB39|nr:condensation domain-containing protein [Streptomyces sp. NBC_01001]